MQQFPFSFWKHASATAPNYLPNVGPTSDLGLVDANTLPNMGPGDVVGFAYNFFTVTRTAPLKRNIINLNGSFAAIAPDPSGGNGYSMFVWCDTFNIGPGQGIGSSYDGAPYPDGSSIDGAAGFQDSGVMAGGRGGSGGSGGGGGNADNAGVGLNATPGSLDGTNGSDGQSSAAGEVGPGGRGTGANDLDGSPWTPFSVGGNNGSGVSSTFMGVGAGGQSGGTPDTFNPEAAGGGGCGGAYLAIVCNTFGGTGPGTAGLVARGGNGASSFNETSEESMGGGGGVIEVFCKSYDGSFVPFLDGGQGSMGSPADAGTFLLYELNSLGAIIATHTDPTDTWNNL